MLDASTCSDHGMGGGRGSRVVEAWNGELGAKSGSISPPLSPALKGTKHPAPCSAGNALPVICDANDVTPSVTNCGLPFIFHIGYEGYPLSLQWV